MVNWSWGLCLGVIFLGIWDGGDGGEGAMGDAVGFVGMWAALIKREAAN